MQHRRQDKSALDKTLQLKDRMVMDWAIFFGGLGMEGDRGKLHIFQQYFTIEKKTKSDLHQMIKHYIHFPTISNIVSQIKNQMTSLCFVFCFFFWRGGGHRWSPPHPAGLNP